MEPPRIPAVPPLFESIEEALAVLRQVREERLVERIAGFLGERDVTGFPDEARGPLVEEAPAGWTILSGIDADVAEGLATASSELALRGSPWLTQAGNISEFEREPPRGHMIFPEGTDPYWAAFAVLQSAALVGRVPDPEAQRILLEDRFQIGLRAIGVYVPHDLAGDMARGPVWQPGPEGGWLDMRAPMGTAIPPDGSTSAPCVLGPGIVFTHHLTEDEVTVLGIHAKRTNRPLPLISWLGVGRDLVPLPSNGDAREETA